jgi:hypothetical protein
MLEKPPFIPFFVDDWLADERLRLCSLEARGLWTDMLCLMHKCDRRGYLQQASGKPFSKEQLARIAGCSAENVSRLLQELIDSGVPSVNEHGVIYSRRMVRDEHIRQVRSAAGRKGGETTTGLLKQNAKQTSSKSQANGQANSGMEWNVNSSGEGGAGGRGPPPPEPAVQPQPEGFATTAEGLAQAWCFYLKRKKYRGQAADHPEDMAPQFAEMLRLGHRPEVLLAQIETKGRDRTEHFWQFKKRLGEPTVDEPRESNADYIARMAAEREESERRRQQARAAYERRRGGRATAD